MFLGMLMAQMAYLDAPELLRTLLLRRTMKSGLILQIHFSTKTPQH